MKKEIILDRIKGCLASVALADKFQTEEILKEKDKAYLPAETSNFIKALIASFYAFMQWEDDIYVGGWKNPAIYLKRPIKALWQNTSKLNYKSKPPFLIPALTVGLLTNWVLSISENKGRDVRVIVRNIFNSRKEYSQKYIERLSTEYGVIAALVRCILMQEETVTPERFKLLMIETALRESYGDSDICLQMCGPNLEMMLNGKKLAEPLTSSRLDYFFIITDWKSYVCPESSLREYFVEGKDYSYPSFTYEYHVKGYNKGLIYAAIMGVINGYDSCPVKDLMESVKAMDDIDILIKRIEEKYFKATI